MQELLRSSVKVQPPVLVRDPAAAAGSSDLLTSNEFRMYAYKILPCPKRSNHEWTTCPYAHPAEKARRRDPRVYNYLAIPCEATKQGGTCPRGDECPNCHSLFEYWLHPSRYRTQLCRDMENGYCRRQVCFFAHSIEELRVPDHSHLHIPPEMQASACGRGYGSTSTSQESTDTTGTTGVETSDTSALQTITMEGSGDQKIAVGSQTARYQPCSSSSSTTYQAGGRARKHHDHGTALNAQDVTMFRAPSTAQPWLAGNYAFHAMHSPSDIRSEDGCSGLQAAFNTTQPNSRDQTQASATQLLSQRLFRTGSSYKKQLEALVAAEQSAQVQHVQQQLTMQQTIQQSALWPAPSLTHSSLAGYAHVDVGSPNLSPVQDTPVSCISNSSTLLAACSTSSSADSLLPAAASDWQDTALGRTLSIPAAATFGTVLECHGTGLVNPSHASAGTPQFACWGDTVQQRQSSLGSYVFGDQDMTLATFLGCSAPDSKWPPAASVDLDTSLSGPRTSGLPLPPLSCGLLMQPQPYYTPNSGTMLEQGVDLSTANLLLLQQQQQQALQGQQMVEETLGMLQAACGLGVAGANPQVANDVLGALMQQLMLQQCSQVG